MKTKVLYIAGCGRSGTTLLTQVIGQLDPCFDVGEFSKIWKMGIKSNPLCGCGEPFSECEFWSGLATELGWYSDDFDIARMRHLKHTIDKMFRSPWRRPFLKESYRAMVKEYALCYQTIYQTIQKRSGCSVIVDSSKSVPSAYVLANAPELEVHLVHLIRDPRATEYSWKRIKELPNTNTEAAFMARRTVWQNAYYWNRENRLVEKLKKTTASYQCLRYKAFVENPRDVLTDMMNRLGVELPTSFLADRSEDIHPTHAFSGNPWRYGKKRIQIKIDNEWQRKASFLGRWGTVLLTYRLMRKHGYALSDSFKLPTR
jgi:hypothetical protein